MKTVSLTAALLGAMPLANAWGWGPPNEGHSGTGESHHPHHGGPWHTSTGPSSKPTGSPAPAPGKNCTALTADEITSMGNNSLFTRWRPYSHVEAPAGWMNDPCGPMYDPTLGIYHIFYQWHPQHINWGNISWGHATSKDLITWTDQDDWRGRDALALSPGGNGTYNGLGIFSGTAAPVNLQGETDGTLLLFYTSVPHLPIGWNAPYIPGSETTSIAISTDGGKTFHNYENNPVIDATVNTPPMYWNVTGFRDPFVHAWPEMDTLLEVSEPHYYAVYGSGIRGVGPRMPFWTAPASDLTKWTFLGALWEPKDNTTLGPLLSTGTYAFNFEVSGFFSLPDSKGKDHFFVNMGTEGGNVSFHESNHWALWNEGTVSRRVNGSAEFTPISGGAGDWGLSYALTSFNDTKNNRRVQWAWAPDDWSGVFSANQNGYNGALNIPRELFVHEVEHVVKTPGLAENKNSVLTQNNEGTYTATTLGVKPLPDVVAGLRSTAAHKSYSGKTYKQSTMLETQGHSHMELKATLTSATGAVGLVIAASPDMKEYTTISYQPSNNTVLVERLHSSTIVEFNNATVTGYFYPYTVGCSGEADHVEEIIMDVWIDGSLVEVYVNDRFALSTRIYPSMECSTGFGVYVEPGHQGSFKSVEAYMGTLNVWPERPVNSSSPLVFDTSAETDDYVWWAGN
ncbi:glycoside hydrolase family 32 protein [Acrodontium crateriforme]|uniref:Glycoside hydrolase family 32 protein n=1 Tax=Acrodontium crateriforme TaxID=150365 RepID=A0AAQ3R7A4_9PEZI|nr:glycoside hydrolase family 32 protein [Acrodontium crateriforme]